MRKTYETVIGLEVHVELATKTKIFCGCSTAFGGKINTHTCPVCTGMPGSLPVLNKKVVEYAIAVGLALNCRINRDCAFDRKNYFYPDNPQNYQISQLYHPLCQDGHVLIRTSNGIKSVGIHEIHMEEDAGKLVHDEWEDVSIVDYNRSGVPLIEIVSEPDLRSPEEVIEYLEKLRTTIQYLGASDCKLNEGSMRADINLSVREVGSTRLGTRTEMKNLNSFRAIRHAIEGETRRQIELMESGRKVIQETRRWDDNKESSTSMRSKEDAKDYRYFPEPDLPKLHISKEWIEQIRSKQPEFREEKIERYQKEFALPIEDARIITGHKPLADLFEEACLYSSYPKKIANWLMGETLRLMKEQETDVYALRFSAKHLADLVELTESGRINSAVAKSVFERMFDRDCDPLEYVKSHRLEMIQDEEKLEAVIASVLHENKEAVLDYHSGKEKALARLIGQSMKALAGKADPTLVRNTLLEKLK